VAAVSVGLYAIDRGCNELFSDFARSVARPNVLAALPSNVPVELSPVPAVSALVTLTLFPVAVPTSVLLVSVSVVARAITVSLAPLGKVNVMLLGFEAAGNDRKVRFEVPNAIWDDVAPIPRKDETPVMLTVPFDGVSVIDVGDVIVSITGLVKVLLVNVSVVARHTTVSVLVGNVRVPVLTMVAMTGAVRVLLVSVSVVARPTRVSVVVGVVKVIGPAGAGAETVVVFVVPSTI